MSHIQESQQETFTVCFYGCPVTHAHASTREENLILAAVDSALHATLRERYDVISLVDASVHVPSCPGYSPDAEVEHARISPLTACARKLRWGACCIPGGSVLYGAPVTPDLEALPHTEAELAALLEYDRLPDDPAVHVRAARMLRARARAVQPGAASSFTDAEIWVMRDLPIPLRLAILERQDVSQAWFRALLAHAMYIT